MLRAISRRFVGVVSDYPLKTAGLIAVLAGGRVAYRSLSAAVEGTASATMGLTLTHLVEFASAQPAYVLAVVVGLALIVRAE
ncbi:hypothetical protein [Haladaptatus sp. DJG-WS-42]|uniref:hypothetical protein n=1 Tax=Haladaptatus sp. DJG-WS-42 TaxID=3120516 RepID=UPI0030D0218C